MSFYNREKQDNLQRVLRFILGTENVAVGFSENMAGYSCALYFHINPNQCFHDSPVEAIQKDVYGVLSKTMLYINLEARIKELEEELKEYKSTDIQKTTLSDL